MGGGPRNPRDAPADCLATVSVIHHTSEVPVVTEDDAATVTGREQDSSNAVAEEVQTVKANNQDPPVDSQEQRIAKLKGIYAGLVMVESECIEADGKHLLATGIELVEQILRDLKSAKEKAKKEAAEAKVEQETVQAEEDNKHSNPDPEAMPTSVGERLDETASKEAEAEEAELEEVDHEKTSPKVTDANADAALDEVTVTTHPVDQNANLSVQEPQASPEEAGTAPADSGKDTADTGVDTTALTKETKSESEKKPKTELPCYVEFRQLGDQNLYKKVGSEYWVLIDSQWVPSLNAEQFAALIELHRTLLHKHYDFLSESQHPSASAALKRLAAKHGMLGRMWWHGIHSFLEVMRKRLVESGEHMACFIILAYKMMSLLEETVPRFRHTWIQCKADLLVAQRGQEAGQEQRKAELVKSEAEAKDATATPEGSQTTAEEDKVPREESTAATEETTTSDAAHEKDLDTKTPDWELVYANTLPEHSLLAGFFFAREAEPEPRDKSLEKPAEDAVVVACPAVPDATPAAVQTVDESVEASLVEVRREENENEDVQQQDSQAKEVEAEKAQEEDEQKDREAEEVEVRRREGLHRDPPLFLNGWFKRSKHDYNDIQVRNYVQDAATCDARSNQLLHLAAQLIDRFFVFETDEERRYWISVPGASSVPKPDPNKKRPEIIERDGGVRVVYVHPLFHAAEIEREKRRAAREEKWQKEKERQKEKRQKEEERQKEKKRKEDEAKATADVATALNEKAEGDAKEVSVANNGPEASQLTDTTEQQPTQSEKPVSQVDAEKATEAVNLPAVAPSTVSEDGDHEPSSAYEMDLDKAIGLEKATAAAQKPPVTHEADPTEAEPTKAKVEMTLPVRGVDDAHTKGSGAGSDAAAATTTAPAADAATDPQVTVPLSEGVLDSMPKTEDSTKAIKRWRAASKGPGADEGADEDEDKDEKEWERLSNESHGDVKVETTSMFSRFFFGR
ncbi:uncharacterized protein FMAN_14237 [Fusarium mangiferae]|uniref:Uncharacterized protein n=1 Tax=Fusarium mangiferae TaxID=192010 RepID=A0A1L7UCF8_FUSMA|nr:uncharacterized protein FMAN_14237 [Fusarium mangiferae]CVL08099.1 uncharacterized protein FMAN_14237 [Fusarium mangiferae]